MSAGRHMLAPGASGPHPSRMRWTVTRALAVLVMMATVALLPAGPAAAVPGPVDGYVWANQPGTADYTITHAWAYNSTGGDISIHRVSAGNYHVRFGGMSVPGGIAHARPYGSGNTAICMVASFGRSSGDLLV